jgi:hypothetical protein
MTVEGLVASLAWTSVAGYATWRADLLVAKALALRSTRDAERIASSERIASLRASAAAKDAAARRPINAIELPDDLEAVALQESEPWARDNERQIMRERFQELQVQTGQSDAETWQAVRRAVGVGELP